MRLLVLGGTSFVGRHIVDTALGRGHQVTLFHRGLTNPGLFPQAEHRRGDRSSGDYEALRSGAWDATVDVSAYVPRHVEQALEALDGRGGHEVLISSVSAYDPSVATRDEGSALHPEPAPDTESIDAGTYGPLKAACERAAARRLPADQLAVIRPTYVVGPHDPTDRFTYWARLMDRGGPVPIAWPDEPVQVVDVRDLALFVLTVAVNRHAGAFDAVGPSAPLSRFVADLARPERPYRLVEVDPQVLHAGDVTLPLVDGDPMGRPLMARLGTRAVAAGLTTRSLTQSARDTVAWDRDRGAPPLRVGPTPEQLRRLVGQDS